MPSIVASVPLSHARDLIITTGKHFSGPAFQPVFSVRQTELQPTGQTAKLLKTNDLAIYKILYRAIFTRFECKNYKKVKILHRVNLFIFKHFVR